MHERKWRLTFRRSISGWMLVKARRPGGKVAHGREVPPAVRQWALADDHGIVIDPEAVAVIETAAKGRYEVTLDADVTTKPTPRGWRAQTPPHLNWDDGGTSYLGDGNDGVHFGAMKQGSTWWALATVDSDTGGFVDTLAAEGGYKSEKAARTAAEDAARDWLHTNNISVD